MKFYITPENEGQTVEVSYAITPEGVIRCIEDRHDRSVEYAIHKWTRALDDYDDPWNREPPVARGWRRISQREVDAIERDE